MFNFSVYYGFPAKFKDFRYIFGSHKTIMVVFVTIPTMKVAIQRWKNRHPCHIVGETTNLTIC
ncbi:Uncharacterised protein [Segatella copri]|nr:Uncharacterised protein [Segatella copri]